LLPRQRGTRLVLIWLAVPALAAALVWVLLRHYAAGNPLLLGTIAATPYVVLLAPLVGLVLMLIARQWIGVGAAVLVLALATSTQLWLYTADDPPKDAVVIHVMTANLRLGQADARDLVGSVRRHSVDVLMLEELTAGEQDALVAAGLNDLLPHHSSAPEGGGFGTGLWSRFPMSDAQQPDQFTFGFVTARLAVPGVARPVQAAALHASGPVPSAVLWQQDMRGFAQFLPTLAGDRPVIVGGDFNATPDTVQFRRILDAGFSDAADQAGGGYTATFPGDRWFPPLIAIDHVLSRGGPVATGVDTVTIKGSDHRALLVSVALPRT
jgi:endonuclease/exonuclease/phosphatase (EEP) superfamily protein YafD